MHLFTDQWHPFSFESTMYIFYGIISFANQTSDAASEISGLPSSLPRIIIHRFRLYSPEKTPKFDKANEQLNVYNFYIPFH